MSDSEKQLLLACLAVLLRRAHGTVVMEDADIDKAYSALDEFTWRRDAATKTLRLSVPVERR